MSDKKPPSIDAHLMRDYHRTERKYLATRAGRIAPRTSLKHRLSKLNEPGGMFNLSGGQFSPGVKVWAALFVVLSLSIGIGVWAEQPSNGLFHNYHQEWKALDISQPKSCIAPCAGSILVGSEQEIFLENWATGSGANWNVLCGSFNSNFQSSGPAILLQSNSTCASEMLSKTAVEISQVARQEFVMRMPILMPSVAVSNNLIMFLTTNSTLPNSGENFNPQNSVQVALMLEVNRNNYYVTEIQKDATFPILPSGYARVCGSTTQNGPELMCAATSSWDTASGGGNYIDLVLNFTGNTQTGSVGSYAEQNQYGSGTCGTSPCSSVRNSGDLPWLLVSGVKYYVGVWNARNNPTIGIGGTGGGGDLDIAFATPFTVSAAPSIDDSGFFGPIIRALIQIGVFIVQNILSFAAFLWNVIQAVFATIMNILAPALATLVTIITGVIKSVLDAIGNALGLGAIGTNLFTFLGDIGAFFTTFFGNSLAQLSSFITFLTNGYATVSASFGTYWTDLVNWTSGIKDFLAGLWVIAGQLFTISFAFMFSGWLLYGAKKFSDSVGEGMEWFNLTRQFIMLGVAITLFVFTMTVHYVLTPAMNMIQSVGEAKKTAEPDIEIGGTGVG